MTDKYYVYVGNAIRNQRNAKGFTQQYVADSLGIGRPIYSQYERGACTITMKRWLEIANFLQLDAYQVMLEAMEFDKGSLE